MHGPIYDYLEKKKLKFSYQGYFKKKKKLYDELFLELCVWKSGTGCDLEP